MALLQNICEKRSIRSKGFSQLFNAMQAKHQDKQMKEREEKLLKLYEGVESHGKENSTPFGFSVGGGKVRHLFQSRRRDVERKNAVLIAGRDKSYPLEPLKNHEPYARKLDRRQTFAGETGRNRALDQSFRGQRSCSSEGCKLKSRPKNNFPHISNKSIEEFKYNRADILRQINSFRSCEKIRGNRAPNFKPSPSIADHFLALGRKTRNVDTAESVRLFSSAPRIPFASPFGHRPFTKVMEEKYRNFSSGNVLAPEKKGETWPLALKVGSFASVSTSSYEKKLTKAKSTPLSLTSSPTVFQKTITVEAPNRELQAPSAKNRTPPPPRTPTFTGRTVERPSLSILAAPLSSTNLDNCKNCGRNFHSDRVSKHRLICRKSKKSKRKPFDALQQRLRGTEAEKYVKQPLRNRPEQSEKPCTRRISWREKHEELIRNLRAAKKATAHLKKGGKLVN